MNHLRLLPLLILFGLLACTMPVTERTAIPATGVPTVYLPRVTTNVESTAAPTATPAVTDPSSSDTPIPTATATQNPALDPTDIPTAEPSATPEPTAAGFACFGTQDGGMACTSAAGDWITPPDNGTIRGITACSDQIVIAGDVLLLFDGTAFAPQDAPFAPTHISCAADDALWIASDTNIAVYAKGEWTTHTGSPTAPIRSLAAVSETTAWTASAVTVDRIENGTWTTYADQSGLDDTYLFEQIITAPDGTVWAVATNTLLRFNGTEWVNQYSEPLPPLSTIAFDSNEPTIATLYDGLFDKGHIIGGPITTLAYSEGGRPYIGSPYGLFVNENKYIPSNSTLTHPHVTQIAIVGTPLYVAQGHQAGMIIGSIVDVDGNAVADSTVIICDDPLRRFYVTTPCTPSFSPEVTTTNGDGTFSFEVSSSTYHIVYMIGEEWVGLSEEITVGEGETVDVGRLSRVQQP